MIRKTNDDRIKNHFTLKFSMGHHVNVLKTKEIKCVVTFFLRKFNKQLRHLNSLEFLKLKCNFLAECTNNDMGPI